MSPIEPTYTIESCRAAYQLNWSLGVFWNHDAPIADRCLPPLQHATEPDGVRILEHQFTQPNASQFLLSTSPSVAPAMVVRSIKGRLQHLVRDQQPRAFRRNYSIHGTGSVNLQAMERYVASQLNRHPMADPRVQERLAQYQLHDGSVDLSIVRSSAYGQFVYNLHIVLVHGDRGVDVRDEWLRTTTETIRRTARKKGHLLSRVSPTADHLHMTLGCDVAESPADVVLSYMNNLAYVQGKPIFQFGFYAGTFGRYDLDAVRT